MAVETEPRRRSGALARNRPPKLEYILARAEEAKQRDAGRDEKFDTIEKLRHRQHTVPVPPNFAKFGTRVVKVPLLDEAIRVIKSHIVKAFPTVEVPPQSLTKVDQEKSSKLEKCLNALLAELDGAGGPHRAYADGSDFQAMFGLNVDKIIYLPDAWDASEFERRMVLDKEKIEELGLSPRDPKAPRRPEKDDEKNRRVDAYKQSAPRPVVWLTPDPRTYHPYYENGRLVEVFEISERSRHEILDRYEEAGVDFYPTDSEGKIGRLVNPRFGEPLAPSALTSTGGLSDKVEFVEHWQEKIKIDEETHQPRRTAWVTYSADQVILDQFDTDYNQIGYFPAFGLSTASRDPKWECQSVVEEALDLVQALDQLYTQWLSWGFLAAYPMGTYEKVARNEGSVPVGADNLPPEEPEPLTWEPGKIVEMAPGENLKWIIAPAVGADLKLMAEQLSELCDRAVAVPDILKGESKAGTPAWLGAQLQAAGRRIFDPLTDNRSVALTNACKFILWLIEHKHQDVVYVQSVEADKESGRKATKSLALSPEDIDGYYNLTVHIRTLTDDRRLQLGYFYADMYKGGGVTKRMWRTEGLGIEAPEEVEDERVAEDFVNSPQYKQVLFDNWMRFYGFQGAQQQAQQIGPPGAPGGAPGQPPLDPRMVQALEMARAQGGAPAPGGPPGMMPQGVPVGGGASAYPGRPAARPPVPGQGLPMQPPMRPPGAM